MSEPVKIKAGGKDLIVKGPPPLTLPPNTTEQEDMVTAGQRRVNLVWEFTQAIIAVMITAAIVYCAIKGIDSRVLNNAFFLIVSMYFVRTNHHLIGGVGPKIGTR
jgi:hypothetical protein